MPTPDRLKGAALSPGPKLPTCRRPEQAEPHETPKREPDLCQVANEVGEMWKVRSGPKSSSLQSADPEP